MMCRNCQERESESESAPAREDRRNKRRARPTVTPITAIRKGEARVRDHLCSRCGNLIGAEDTALRVRAKQSQLARFGLGKSKKPLLERRPRPRHRGDR